MPDPSDQIPWLEAELAALQMKRYHDNADEGLHIVGLGEGLEEHVFRFLHEIMPEEVFPELVELTEG